MSDQEKEARFEVLKAIMAMMNGMHKFNESDYGKGMMQGIMVTLRALELEADFQQYLQKVPAEKEQE